MAKVSFNPNPSGLTYTAHGKEAEKIGRSKIGVVTHLKYHGSDVADMSAHHDVDHENFKHSHNVYHVDPRTDTSRADYDKKKQDEFHHHMAAAKKIHDAHGREMYPATEKHTGVGGHLETYVNHTVRTSEKPTSKGLSNFVSEKHAKLREKYKTQAKRDAVEAERKAHVSHIRANAKHYDNLLAMHGHLQRAKNVLVHALNKSTDFEHTHRVEKANPEGYVVHHGTPSKLVDRSEFSRRNLTGRSR